MYTARALLRTETSGRGWESKATGAAVFPIHDDENAEARRKQSEASADDTRS